MSYLIFINGSQVNEKGISFARTLQVNDIANITTRNSNYTGTIKLPRTSNNVQIFEDAFNVGATSNFPYTKATCNVIDADTGQHVIYNGWAVLLESTENEYSINITDGSIDFYQAIEQLFITQIGISELNHVKNLENVVDTWNDEAIPYRYILADYNGNNEITGNVNIDYQVPCVSIPYLWNKIFEFIGWDYTGSIFTHEKFTNLWMSYPKPLSLDAPIITTVTTQQSQIATQLQILSQFGFLYTINAENVVLLPNALGYDAAYYNFTTGSQVTGVYRFSFTAATFTKTVGNDSTSRVQLVVKDQMNQNVSVNYIDISLGNYIDLTLSIGDRVFLTLVDQNNNVFKARIFFFAPVHILGTVTTTMELIQGYTLGFDEAFINYKVIDFVREILIRFGLTPFKDKYSNTVNFLTLYEILQNQNTDDWSSRFSRKLSEKYVFGNYGKSNIFKYKYNDDEMVHNNGSFRIQNLNLPDEYTLLNSQIYSPERLQSDFLNGSNVYKIWDKEIKDDGTVTYKDLDNRFYFLRAERINESITLGSTILGGTETNAFYFRESYYRLPFSDIIEDWYRPIKTIFDKARLVTIEAYLKPVDIFNYDFTRLIFIDKLSSYYLVNKINNFVKGKLTKVELIEVDFFRQQTIEQPPTPIDYTLEVTDVVIADCEVIISLTTDYELPTFVQFLAYAGSYDVLSNLQFNELNILPIQTQEIFTGEATFDITQLPYNILGYKFGVKILTQNAFDTINSTLSDVIVLDGTCYIEPSLTELDITAVTLLNTEGLANIYNIEFTSDVTLPVQLFLRVYTEPSGGFPPIFGGWSNYEPYYVTENNFDAVIGTLFGAPSKFQIKIAAVTSPEFIL